MKRTLTWTTLVVILASSMIATGSAASAGGWGADVRFATFNASLNRAAAGQLLSDLSKPGNEQADKVAEVIQRNRPDVLLVNEFDYVPDNAAANAFRANYRGCRITAPTRWPTRTP